MFVSVESAGFLKLMSVELFPDIVGVAVGVGVEVGIGDAVCVGAYVKILVGVTVGTGMFCEQAVMAIVNTTNTERNLVFICLSFFVIMDFSVWLLFCFSTIKLKKFSCCQSPFLA